MKPAKPRDILPFVARKKPRKRARTFRRRDTASIPERYEQLLKVILSRTITLFRSDP